MENKKYKVALVSLGCEKNLVDSEMILGFCNKFQFEIVTDVAKAKIIIVNTCGFIESAKKEAIDTILSVLKYQKKPRCAKIVVTGCLVQRYEEELKKSIPEVDCWIPIREYPMFGDKIASLLKNTKYSGCGLIERERYISTQEYMAYVRLSDGCNNCCTYCAIPIIRGGFRSRPMEDILLDIKQLVSEGRKEIVLISQDLSTYGKDIHSSLDQLLTEIVKIEGDYWLRLLYLYPDEITEDFIQTVKNNSDKILPYFDIPVQHASDKILSLMHRRGNQEFINHLIDHIREEMPNAIIRTTLIVGFPHETKKDFEELKNFVRRNRFDHLGAFTYSKEEDTLAYKMTGQVPEKVKTERLNEIMDIQRMVSLSQNQKHLNQEYDCIIEGYDDGLKKYTGRTYMFAPDDIDGCVYIDPTREFSLGEKIKIKVYDADFYDLSAKEILK